MKKTLTLTKKPAPVKKQLILTRKKPAPVMPKKAGTRYA